MIENQKSTQRLKLKADKLISAKMSLEMIE